MDGRTEPRKPESKSELPLPIQKRFVPRKEFVQAGITKAMCAENEKLTELWLAGVTIDQIGFELGLSSRHVSRLAYQLGLPPRRGGRPRVGKP
jgi:hypothetical protein